MKKSLNKAKKKTIISDGFSIKIGIIPKISVGNTLYSPDGLYDLFCYNFTPLVKIFTPPPEKIAPLNYGFV